MMPVSDVQSDVQNRRADVENRVKGRASLIHSPDFHHFYILSSAGVAGS
jgi:hypothetical protein